MVRYRSDQDPGRSDDTPEQAEFRARVRAWHDRHATPRSYDDLWRVPLYVDEARAEESFENGRAWQRTLFEHGWAGITWPRAYGGGGGEPWQARIFSEVGASYEEWPGFIGATIAMLGPTLLHHGTEEQKRGFVPRLLSGEVAFCQLFSEPGAGSDLAGLAMRAERDGDEFVVNGQKVWNSQAQFCDWGFLLVRTDPDAPKHRGITFLLVEMTAAGIEARPLVQMNGSAHFNEVFFDDVRVPVANAVGEINGGWGPARTVLLNEVSVHRRPQGHERCGSTVGAGPEPRPPSRRPGTPETGRRLGPRADAALDGRDHPERSSPGRPAPDRSRDHEAVRRGVEATQRRLGRDARRPGRGG